jgi:hypothetical protein
MLRLLSTITFGMFAASCYPQTAAPDSEKWNEVNFIAPACRHTTLTVLLVIQLDQPQT